MRETQVQSLGREDPWRRKRQLTPVLLPGESHGGRNLVGYSTWGRKESETTERLHFHFHFHSDQSIQHIKKQRHYFANKDLSRQSYGFSSGCIWMWELECEESWKWKKLKVNLLSRVRLSETPWTVAYQAPHSVGFSRQEYWSGLPFPSPGDLPNLEIVSRIAGRRFTIWATREAQNETKLMIEL